LAGLAIGWTALPGIAASLFWLGSALGIPGEPPARQVRGPALLASTLVLAPIFEEIIYRGQLLPALAARLGKAPGLLLSSAAFALPHAAAWPIFGSFGAGLLLGALMLARRSIALCVGIHAGFNLRLAAADAGEFPAPAGFPVISLLLVLALALRFGPRQRRPATGARR
jgi:membrane protease YdiL (CAAX protease family)